MHWVIELVSTKVWIANNWLLWVAIKLFGWLFICSFLHFTAARLLPIGVGIHSLTNPGLSPITNPALNPILHPALIPVQARIAALRARVAALVSLFQSNINWYYSCMEPLEQHILIHLITFFLFSYFLGMISRSVPQQFFKFNPIKRIQNRKQNYWFTVDFHRENSNLL